MKTPKFLIIDGSSMLSTAYYGNLPKQILFAKTDEEKEKHYGKILHTSQGVYTNAIYTMMRTLLNIHKKVHPDYVAFVFDKSRNTFRRTELGADFYKANRKSTPTPLKEQFLNMENLLEEIGCQVLYGDDYEADDYAASLVTKFEGPGIETYVITKDHDYFQLVSQYTRMWRPMQKDKCQELKDLYNIYADSALAYQDIPDNMFEYTPEIVFQEEGVYPEEIVPMLAIAGDPGDGIPGCKGVAKPAAALIHEYKTIDNMYSYIDACEGNAKQEKELAKIWKEYLGISRSPIKPLKENRNDVYLSEKLACMKRDIPIEQNLEDFATNINMDKLKEQLEKYELNSLSEEIFK